MGGPLVWLHGDLKAGNLLIDDARLVSVIDWGGVGIGDPALDLTPAWLSLRPSARAAFREAAGPRRRRVAARSRMGTDDLAAGAAVLLGPVTEELAEGARRAIAAVLEEFG